MPDHIKTPNKRFCLLLLATLTFITLLLSVNPVEAARVAIGIGTYYGSSVVYIPGHWYRGYWIPGQYVEYAGPAPGPSYIWYEGGVGYNGYWRHGHWGHGGGHHHH